MKSKKTDTAFLNALGLQRASDLLPKSTRNIRLKQKPATVAQYAVELTVGVDPDDLVRDAVLKVRNEGLQTFLKRLVLEPEVLPVLTQRINSNGVYQRHAIQYLRVAAESIQYWCAMGQEERQVLYAATFVLGIQTLLQECIVGNATARDVMFTIARPHLYQLDESAPRSASLLRQCLGWCNEDEVDGEYVPRLQQSVQRAVVRMNWPRALRADSNRRNPGLPN